MNGSKMVADLVKQLMNSSDFQGFEMFLNEFSDEEMIVLNSKISKEYKDRKGKMTTKAHRMKYLYVQNRHKEVEFDQDNQFTWNQWNHIDWIGNKTQISGSGPYRYNQYGTTGFAHWQHRFETKDDMIRALEWECRQVRVVEIGDPQYQVREDYGDLMPSQMADNCRELILSSRFS